MKSNQSNWTKVTPEEVQEHALRTSLKSAYSSTSQKDKSKLKDEILYNNHEYFLDNWFLGDIETSFLVIRHKDFRNLNGDPFVPEGFHLHLFSEFVENNRFRIIKNNNVFPESDRIISGLNPDYPPIIVIEDEQGRYLVNDGQLRTITACYHNQEKIKAYIYKNTP